MKEHILRASIRWNDGTYDSQKACSECGLDSCPYPVHQDYYPVRASKTAKKFEAESFNETDDNPGVNEL